VAGKARTRTSAREKTRSAHGTASRVAPQPPARGGAADPLLDRARAEIDRIDERILALLSTRARLAQRIGRRKAANGNGGRADGFWVPSREKRIYQRLRALNKGPLADDVVRAIFREIISASRALEARVRVAFLGPEGTFTNAAAREVFGAAATLVPSESIAAVFTEVEQRRVDFGVVPVENSTEGAVTSTLDLLVDSPLRITGEVRLDVEQCLLGTATDWSTIRRVLSHPQGLAQCRRWLATHLPHAELEAVASTSRAADLAAEDPTTAAIASRMAGERSGIQVLAARIQDEVANATRFFVLGHRDAESASGDDKTSVVCTVKDEVGVLAKLLQPLAAAGVSLHKIESRPLRGRPWEYVFFLDLRGHRSDARVKRALARMTPLTTSLKILGSYPAA
jgi:chorismate mutase/prephenate dehydratase